MAVVHIGFVELLPLVVAHHVAVHHLPAPEVVDGVEHLQRAAVALLHHFLHPVRVLIDAAQLGGHELLGRLQARAVGVAHVGDVELRVRAIQVLDGQRDAAQVLERVIGIKQAAQVGRAREHGRTGAAQVFGVGVDLAARGVGQLAAPVRGVGAIGPGHAREVELFELAVALFPHVGGERGVGQLGAVVAAFVAKDAGQGKLARFLRGHALRPQRGLDALGVGADEVLLAWLGLLREQLDGLVEAFHHVGELVAVQAGERDHRVDARAPQFLQGNHLHAHHAPALVPARFDAHGIENLRLQHAQVAQGFGAPHAESQLLGELAMLGLIGLDQRLHRLLARLVGGARGDARGIKAIHVAPGVQGVGVADRVAAVGRVDPARRQALQHALHLPGRAQRDHEAPPLLGQHAQLGIVQLAQRALAEDPVVHKAVGHGFGQVLVVALERSLGVFHARGLVERLAQHLHHVADEVGALGVQAQGVQAQRLLGSAQVFKVVLQVAQELVKAALQLGHLPLQVFVDVHLHGLRHDQLAVVVLHQAGIERLVFADQVVDAHEVFRQTCRRERRGLVAHDHAAPAPFHVQRLADVVHDVGIDHRRVAHQQVGFVVGPQAALLAGRPLLRAMRAKVHDGVRRMLLTRPQVGGQVEVVERHLGVVEQLFFVVVARRCLAAHGLGQHHELAQLHARNDKALLPLVAHHPGALLGRAPEGGDALAHLDRQTLEPALVARQGQKVPMRRLHQLAQGAAAVRRTQQRGHGGDDVLLGGGIDAVALGAQALHQVLQRARHVEVGSTLVLLTRRVVPEEQRQALVGVGRGLQACQVHGLADEQVHLLGHGHQLATLVGADDHRVLQADVFGVGQRERQVEAVDSHGIAQVFSPRALAVRQHVDDRHAHGAVPGLARVGVDAQEGIDQQHLRQHLAVQRDDGLVHLHRRQLLGVGEARSRIHPGSNVGHLHRTPPRPGRRSTTPRPGRCRCSLRICGRTRHAAAAVEHQRQRATRFQRGNRFVEHAGLPVGQVTGRHLHAHHRRALGRTDFAPLPPGQVAAQVGKHALVVRRVVDTAVGQCHRRGHGGGVGALQHGAQVLEQALVVHAHAAHVVVEHALGLYRRQTHGTQTHGRAHHMDAHARQAGGADLCPGHTLNQRLVVGARCIHQHQARTVEHTRHAFFALGIDLRPGQLHALRASGLLHELELALQHHGAADQGHLVRRSGGARQRAAQDCHHPYPACHFQDSVSS